MATVISTTFRLKRGLAAKWQELNLILDPGEPGFELDTYRLKIGDGKTAWNDLPYIGYNGASGGDDGIIVDTVLSDTSLNPIANKTVKAAIDKVEALIEHYEFGDEFIVTEANGIKTVSIDLEVLASLLPQVDTSNFATKEELCELAQTVSDLAAAIAQVKVPSKISELENDVGYLTQHQDLSEYAKKTEIPSVEGLATETYVQQKIAEAELAGGDVDLSLYYTKEEVDAKIPSIEGLATESYIDNKISTIETHLETNYITIEQGVTKETLTETVEKEVQTVVVADLEALVDEKITEAITEGVSVNQIDYGTF